MTKDTIILSMTTWPPRADFAVIAMKALKSQQHSEPVHYVLTLSNDEWMGEEKHDSLIQSMNYMNVEIIWDDGNIMSHKKLMPTLEKYPNNPILVVDDDKFQQKGWLEQFIQDHKAHPTDIIYGNASSRVIIRKGKIQEGISQRGLYTYPGRVTYNEKPANGSAGTLYPAGTFTDKRFYDRELFMRLTPTSDETWQWAWAVMAGKTYRCLSDKNKAIPIGDCVKPLFHINIQKYSEYHNAIAQEFPEYYAALEERIKQNPIKYPLKYSEL